MYHSNTNTLYADSSYISQHKINIELEDSKDNYFAGDCVKGGVRLHYASELKCPTKLDIHLSCTFYSLLGEYEKRKIFKIIVTPCNIVAPNMDYIPFSITIPRDIPSTVKNKTLHGRTIYKIKAIHELTDVPISTYPKASLEINVLDHIAMDDLAYQSPITNEKEIKLKIPKDIIGKNKIRYNKGDLAKITCKLSIPKSCFLPGHNIPISLNIQHVAPIKHMQGIQVQLERISTMTSISGEKSVDALVLSETSLPLICDIENGSSNPSSHITVPSDTLPTIQCGISPLQINYRVRVAINVDMANLVEDTSSAKKRDIAKGMVNAWGKKMGLLEGNSKVGTLFGNTIDLELPITIGTLAESSLSDIVGDSQKTETSTDASSSPVIGSATVISSPPSSPTILNNNTLSTLSLSNESQMSLKTVSTNATSLSPPKLPARPVSLIGKINSPILSTYQLTGSQNSINKTRSITDPFSLINYNDNMTHAQQQPSAPNLDDLETDKKGGYKTLIHERSWSSPAYELDNSNNNKFYT
ncbi:unnamed protein product [Cunninghamella blakesleeana]